MTLISCYVRNQKSSSVKIRKIMNTLQPEQYNDHTQIQMDMYRARNHNVHMTALNFAQDSTHSQHMYHQTEADNPHRNQTEQTPDTKPITSNVPRATATQLPNQPRASHSTPKPPVNPYRKIALLHLFINEIGSFICFG